MSEIEIELKNKLPAGIIALGQVLAERMQELPGDRPYVLTIEADELLEIKLYLKVDNYEVDLWLDYKGEWQLASMPQVWIEGR